MKHPGDIFTRVCLVGILVVLLLTASRQVQPVKAVYAQSPAVYRTDIVNEDSQVQNVLTERSREGWRLVTLTAYYNSAPVGSAGVGPHYLLVFEK